MKNLLNPRLLLLITTFPGLILFFLLYSKYTLVQSLLDDYSKLLWQYFYYSLSSLLIISTGYSLISIYKKSITSIYYTISSLIAYTLLLYFYTYNYEKLLPFSIPQWMVSDEVFFYAGTFLMPTLLHSVFILVAHLTPEEKQKNSWINFVFAISIPAIWYILLQVILPLWRHTSSRYENHVMTILFIVGTVLFLFFVIRAIYILGLKKGELVTRFQLLWKIPISILFPLLGLAINNGFDIKKLNFNEYNAGIFGDFNSAWFYIFAILNGLFICLPNLENRVYRIFLFIARAFTFSYTFYFFIVFIPYLPLSIFAVIVFGLGFLLLTPLLLIIIHTKELSLDFQFLRAYFSNRLLISICTLAILALPSFIIIQFYIDKITLREALNYIYSPDYSKSYKINSHSIQKTLRVVKVFKERNNNRFFATNQKTPYLSTFYNWLVLDNLTLSDGKIQFLEKVFLGISETQTNPLMQLDVNNQDVKITNIKTESIFDENKKQWLSRIDLEITNNASGIGEYSTQISLPTGAWISDYYLFIGDKKEKGILAEKKAAMWVYSQILSARRDPGILYYKTGNSIVFKVFPFGVKEKRKTGIEIIHKEQIEINLDGKKITLGDKSIAIAKQNLNGKVIFIPAKEKQELQRVKRTPYYHFLIDTSIGMEKEKDKYIKKIETLIKNTKGQFSFPRFTFVNSYSKSITKEDWKTSLDKTEFTGGFYLDRPIKQTLIQSYFENKKEFPVLIVITPDIKNALIENDFSDIRFTYPESNLFYEISEEGKFISHSLMTNPHYPLSIQTQITVDLQVYVLTLTNGKYAYLANDNNPSIVLPESIFEISQTYIKEKDWDTGLYLQGKWMSQILHPEISDREWLSLVKYSFLSKFLTPVTSYMVVENEAQKELLRRKQEQVLSSSKSLDLGEDVQRMSEPNFYLLLGLFGFVIWIHSYFLRRRMIIRK